MALKSILLIFGILLITVYRKRAWKLAAGISACFVPQKYKYAKNFHLWFHCRNSQISRVEKIASFLC